MLTLYLTQTTQLLANPGAPTSLYATSDLTGYINTARTQLAGETGCIRAIGSLAVTSASQYYNFSSITGLPVGVQGVYNVRQATRVSGAGQVYMGSRSYPWAELYFLNNPAPVAAAPTEWAQYGQATTGSIVLNTTPDTSYTLNLDCVCEPIALTTDSTVEVIPYPFTDAVPYMAAYYALMSSQRGSDADKMMQRYQMFVARAKGASVPGVLPEQSAQNQAPSAAPQGGR